MDTLEEALNKIRAKSRTKRWLHYMYYKRYINSKYRFSKRSRKLKEKPYCECCWIYAECVHHETYHRLWKERMEDLRSLCKNCHHKIHFIYNKGKNNKKTLWMAFRQLRKELNVFPYKNNWI